MYGLKQTPRAWYSRLDKYIQQQGFMRGHVDCNLYIKFEGEHITMIEVYGDDIIFGINDDRLGQMFTENMQKEIEMSLLEELSFFLGLQVS